MEKHLNVLSQALNKANQAGAFNLQESAIVAQALGAVIQALDKPNPIEEARAAAKDHRQEPTNEKLSAKGVSDDIGEKIEVGDNINNYKK